MARNRSPAAALGSSPAVAAAARAAFVSQYAASTSSSLDELVLAAYCETKAALATAATAGLDPSAAAGERFRAMWLSCYRHLRANPEHALFLLQVEHSPYRTAAHETALANKDDPLLAQVALPDVAARLLPLPPDVLYELALTPAMRLAAGTPELTEQQLDLVATACWRAISKPG